ncbi:membrane protein insertase YidC [Skermania sp. ID1734]|uniref:membrane protein insertase YidC n=1 Tax=Skermania sp. ID1734 TaxID=2597516 RepID=UPI00117CB032|nr:membrane protein insertase YidC [Skermania sp. ID1734]TSD99257.1 membrane protein insertase YidC [Skermania sp. ID1734]
MLNFIYYPVSAILWFWHKAFGFVLGADNGFAWALSVVFLVFTLRLVLYKPFVKQVRTTRQMQELQPQIKALQKKYAGDRQRQALELQKLQKEHGFNPLMGCLPMLAQAPVFIGLYHVLRSFNRTANTGFGPLKTGGMSTTENAMTSNYVFGPDEVQSFLRARLFGVPISAYITQPKEQLKAFADPILGAHLSVPSHVHIALVAVPLMIVAALATHFNSRASVSRQSAAAAAQPQAAIMNKLALYVFPLGVLVGGSFLPIAILVYWVSNNIWTYGQQHLVFGRIDKEEEAKKQEAIERRTQNAPKPGARPDPVKKKQQTQSPTSAPSVDGDSPENAGNQQKKSAAGQPKKSGGSPNSQKRPPQKRSGNRGRPNQRKRSGR